MGSTIANSAIVWPRSSVNLFLIVFISVSSGARAGGVCEGKHSTRARRLVQVARHLREQCCDLTAELGEDER
jgi:hypothetical protein